MPDEASGDLNPSGENARERPFEGDATSSLSSDGSVSNLLGVLGVSLSLSVVDEPLGDVRKSLASRFTPEFR